MTYRRPFTAFPLPFRDYRLTSDCLQLQVVWDKAGQASLELSAPAGAVVLAAADFPAIPAILPLHPPNEVAAGGAAAATQAEGGVLEVPAGSGLSVRVLALAPWRCGAAPARVRVSAGCVGEDGGGGVVVVTVEPGGELVLPAVVRLSVEGGTDRASDGVKGGLKGWLKVEGDGVLTSTRALRFVQ